MKTTLLALLALLAFAAPVQAQNPIARAPRALATCTVDPASGFIVCAPAPSCVPPLLWHTDRCECADGALPSGPPEAPVCAGGMCTLTITYPADRPATAVVSGPDRTQCDLAGAELAISGALFRSLGGP